MRLKLLDYFVFVSALGICAYRQVEAGPAEGQPLLSIRYAVIGDSYSNGEGASPSQSWPMLLTRHLAESGLSVQLVANPARTGWTTQQAHDAELPLFTAAKPNFATVLIGVNDWVQGVEPERFRKRFSRLLDRMLEILGDKNRLLVVTIPDFSAKPDRSSFSDGRLISQGISEFNIIIVEEATARKLQVVDIFAAAQQMHNDLTFISADGWHYSAKGYAEWEKLIYPAARDLLTK
jgi:acyl-CoA thioesterase I